MQPALDSFTNCYAVRRHCRLSAFKGQLHCACVRFIFCSCNMIARSMQSAVLPDSWLRPNGGLGFARSAVRATAPKPCGAHTQLTLRQTTMSIIRCLRGVRQGAVPPGDLVY